MLEVHHLRYGIIWDMMCEGGCIKGGCAIQLGSCPLVVSGLSHLA